ncbi:hypothetical protein IV203_000096 [Nitzschia inconspicua]|uniref:Uncharacterized protein n=1 Tax=Nitzschia inconspicua TaxID=303405 RepID=A0A9K3L5V7_9STRA|nr:hypothetical protein IV203_000096 [Nitzschia inconspicua]
MADKPQNISLTAREFLYLGLHRTNKTAKPESLARDQWVWFMIEGIAQLKTLVVSILLCSIDTRKSVSLMITFVVIIKSSWLIDSKKTVTETLTLKKELLQQEFVVIKVGFTLQRGNMDLV